MCNLKIIGNGLQLSLLVINGQKAEKLAASKFIVNSEAITLLQEADNFCSGFYSSSAIYLNEKYIGNIESKIKSRHLNDSIIKNNCFNHLLPNINDSDSILLFLSSIDGTFIDDNIIIKESFLNNDEQIVDELLNNIYFDIKTNIFNLSEFNNQILDGSKYQISINKLFLFHKSNRYLIDISYE